MRAWQTWMAGLLWVAGVGVSGATARGADVEPLETITNSIGMKLVFLPAGEFEMGSPDDEAGRKTSEVRHQVRLTKPFYIGTCEVTQAEYEAVMEQNPSQTRGAQHPVERVSWFDAIGFCERLSTNEGRKYRLPTEAEWEYAARAGSRQAWCFGGDSATLPEYAWISTNSGGKATQPVGQLQANRWGLYDMFGNVAEWCQDWLGDYPSEAVNDPVGPLDGHFRVVRGGSGSNSTNYCRAATRVFAAEPTHVDAWYGFRVVSEP